MDMVNEVRRQFREIPGIMEGKGTPEYGKCVEISTKAALRQMMDEDAQAFIADVLQSMDDFKAMFPEIEAIFAGAGPKDKAVRKQLAITAMSFAGHPQVMNDQEKAKTYAKLVRECGYGDGDERLKQYVDKMLGDETKTDAPK